MRLLKGIVKTLVVLAVVVCSLFAIYRYVIPQEVIQQIKSAFMNVKNDMGFYEDSGITGEKYTFDTTYYPYYGYLSDDAKAMYQQIYANALELETSFVPTVELTVNEVVNVINAVYHDHPELLLGVPTYYCTGETQGHAWNIIKLDGGYYNVDVSRADTKSSPERYFNRTDEDLRGTHKRSGYSTILPKCRAKTYEGMED